MDHDEQREQPDPEMEHAQALSYINLVKLRLSNQPDVYKSFLDALHKYQQQRISLPALFDCVLHVFAEHPDLIDGFCRYLPPQKSQDDKENVKPAKRVKTDLDSAKPMTRFASHPSVSFPVNWEAGTSGSISSQYHPENGTGTSGSISSQYRPENGTGTSGGISSQYRPENGTGTSGSYLSLAHVRHLDELYNACKEKPFKYKDGTLYVFEGGSRIMDGPAAYRYLMELINQITVDGADVQHIMERAGKMFQGYPDLLETFNTFLPDGFDIVTVTNDSERTEDF